MTDIHIGSIIEQKVRSSMSITGFADKLRCDRTTVYAIFKRKSIDIERLMQISEILDFDFIGACYSPEKSG